ncbi:hypothetical protein OIDMADRAFT_148736 [Oidiodendron maius Zn]|uniref:Transcription factor domain-containing protein n=1 Tax=Oidiodendron maius (strain Zn) TaxID=913774 RepID=A0A0C3C9U0_OIDMZ|nr:hypothetical protein OIDMADRAFT_148736 [Oidiodendron maius Zn]
MNSASHLLDREEKEGEEGIANGQFNVFGTSPTAYIVLVALPFVTTANGTTVGKKATKLSFAFINNSSPLQAQNAENQKVVRSHVARQSHHQRCLQKYDIASSGDGDSLLASNPGTRNVDPFASLPIEVQPYMWLLIDHSSSNLVLRGVCNSLQTAVYRGQTIRLINDALHDKERAMEDSTFAAVVHLAFHEMMSGDLASWELHMNGLETMIKMKGGLANLGLDGLIHRMISWVDVCGATINHSKPRFPSIRNPHTSLSRPSIHNTHDRPIAVIGLEIKDLTHSLPISIDLANILEDMLRLTTFVEILHGSAMTQDCTYFDDQRASIEHRILAIPGEQDKEQGIAETKNIQESCRLAALIYTNMVFRELQPSAAIHTTLTSRLRNILIQTDLTSCWGNHWKMLLWVLFMGGAVALQNSTRSWFVSILAIACSQLKMQSWHDIKEILLKYLWSDRIWEGRCKYLWFEVEFEHRTYTSQRGLESG